MKFKSDEIREDWQTWLNGKRLHEPFMRLNTVLHVIDVLSQATGHGEITITDFLRPQDFDSYHSKGQAADIRVHAKAKNWYEAMILLKYVLARMDWQVQLVPHLDLYGSQYEHIHIEIDDNSLTKR